MAETAHASQIQQEFLGRLRAATPHVMVTPALLAINIGAFLVMTFLGIDALGGRAEEYLRFGANFAPLTTGGAWWRLVTGSFLHIGILHLAINMWALWDCGKITERIFGNGWFAAVYFFSGMCGSCASMQWDQQAISMGASGAIFGVFGALLAYMTLQRGSVPAQIVNRIRISSGIFVTYALFFGFAHAGVDNAAHLGGFAGGYAMGLILARPLAANMRHAGSLRRAACAALLAAVTVPAAALLTPDSTRIYRQAVALEKESGSYNAEETRLSAAFQSIVEQTRSRKMSDGEALVEMRSRILPAWDDAVARLARIEIDAKAPVRKDYELLMRYAVARRDMMSAIADYLETSDPAREKTIAELRARSEQARADYLQRRKK